MLLSRLVTTNSSSSIRRNLVTNAQVAVAKEKTEDFVPLDASLDPPRRPLTNQSTHQVTNQVPPLEYLHLYKSDLVLRDFVNKENHGQIKDMGAELGVFHWFEQGNQANRYSPTLHQFDRYGQRIDEVQFHPSYHELMQIGMRYGVHSVAWEPLPGSKVGFNPDGHLQHAVRSNDADERGGKLSYCFRCLGSSVHVDSSGSRCLLSIIDDLFGLSCSPSLSAMYEQISDEKFSDG